jgi:hypothetical protein
MIQEILFKVKVNVRTEGRQGKSRIAMGKEVFDKSNCLLARSFFYLEG